MLATLDALDLRMRRQTVVHMEGIDLQQQLRPDRRTLRHIQRDRLRSKALTRTHPRHGRPAGSGHQLRTEQLRHRRNRQHTAILIQKLEPDLRRRAAVAGGHDLHRCITRIP